MTYEQLINKIKSWESFRAEVYICPAGEKTIGYGFTAPCFPNGKVPNTITKQDADELLNKIVTKYVDNVKMRLENWHYNEWEINALLYPLTDFTYNCGYGNLDRLTQYGKRDFWEICEHICQYNKSNGKVLNGLKKRRDWEYAEILDAITKTEPITTGFQRLKR